MRKQTIEQLGVCSWSLKATGPADLAEKVKATGLKKVQLALTPHRNDPGLWGGVEDVLKENGISIVSGMFGTVGEDYTSPETIRKTGGIVPDEHWEENLQIARDAACLAGKMGIPYVSAHAGFFPHESTDPSFNKLIKRIEAITEVFSEHNLELIFETGQETADTLLMFFDELDKRGITNAGVNFDPANMLLYDMDDPVQALQKLIPRVKQIHAKDGKRPDVPGTWGAEVVVGTGEVDWNAFIKILVENDYTGNLVFEREAGDDRIGDIQSGIRYISGVMDT